jgi:hypothetical protein
MERINLLYEYDKSIYLENSNEGKYLVSLLKRGKTLYCTSTYDIKIVVRDYLNKLCFDVNQTSLLITLTSHSMGYIVISSNKLKHEYYLQITSLSLSNPTISLTDIASYLR